ncbi:MAG TPA: GrpB family protein [Gemmatimonadaceae bacterium]|nr:GrpB family protein [Gemmatimonadaceae bacterium]
MTERRPTVGLPSGALLLAAYDPAWADAFEEERALIAEAFGGLPARVEHVGSTSVPGLAAKPIIDILVGRPPESALEPYVDALVGAGYEYRGEYGIPGRHYFVRGLAPAARTHHLHMVALGSALWRDHLAFRDYLRAHPEAAAAYEALKRELAARHADDRGAYSEAKAPFIRGVVAAADPPSE